MSADNTKLSFEFGNTLILLSWGEVVWLLCSLTVCFMPKVCVCLRWARFNGPAQGPSPHGSRPGFGREHTSIAVLLSCLGWVFFRSCWLRRRFCWFVFPFLPLVSLLSFPFLWPGGLRGGLSWSELGGQGAKGHKRSISIACCVDSPETGRTSWRFLVSTLSLYFCFPSFVFCL